jgi:hypothetical protein
MHARPRYRLVHVKQRLTLAEAINQDVHRAAVKAVAAQPEQVIEQARDLGVHDPDVLRALGHLNVHQLLYSQAIGMLVGHHRHVVQAVHIGQRLNERAALGQLFRGAVQQSDMRVSALNDFAIELEHQTQHAMGRGMLGPEVQGVVLDFCHVWTFSPCCRRADRHSPLRE